MTVIGIIPARYDSSRFPGKPLKNILGKSMIRRVYEQAEQSRLEKLIVATDDKRIVDEVLSFNGEVMMTSSEHISGTDRCLEVAQKVANVNDIIINIQGDEPFIEPQQINHGVHFYARVRTTNDFLSRNALASVIVDLNKSSLSSPATSLSVFLIFHKPAITSNKTIAIVNIT